MYLVVFSAGLVRGNPECRNHLPPDHSTKSAYNSGCNFAIILLCRQGCRLRALSYVIHKNRVESWSFGALNRLGRTLVIYTLKA